MADQLTIPLISEEADKQSPDLTYVLLFRNPYDFNSQDELEAKITVEKAQKRLLRIYNFSTDQGQIQEVLEIFKEVIYWLDPEVGKDKEITQKEFLIDTISSIYHFIIHKLRLKVQMFSSRDRDEIFMQIYTNEEWLRNQAEQIGYRIQLNPGDFEDMQPDKNFKEVAPFAPFVTERKGAVENSINLYKKFDYTDQEVSDENGSLFRKADKIRLLFSELDSSLNLEYLDQKGILIQYFAPHNQTRLNYLSSQWGSFKALFKTQPIRYIRNYFGEKIALYFAWMEHYRNFMISAAVVGLGIFIGLLLVDSPFTNIDGAKVKHKQADSVFEIEVNQILYISFAFFMAIWGSLFEQLWGRKEKVLSWRWGTLDYYEDQGQRAAFSGKYQYDEVTGRYKKTRTSNIIYTIRRSISLSVGLLFMSIVGCCVTGIFVYKASTSSSFFGPISGAVMNAIQIRVMNIIYEFIAKKLNDWENHETELDYNNYLSIKLFLFKFVNSYISLFYICFLKKIIEEEGCFKENCMLELSIQLGIIFGFNLIMNIIELGIPFIKQAYRVKSEDRKVNSMIENEHITNVPSDMRTRKEMGPIEKQAKLDAYDNPLEDYLEMVIQYGYVVLFCAAFPLLPLMALIEIVLEIRVDAIKICKLTRRPYPDAAEDIGVWKPILATVSFFGTITNAGIIVFASGAFDDFSNFVVFLSFLILEHVFIMFKIILDVGIQDEPDKVTDGYKWQERITEEKLFGKGNIFDIQTQEWNEEAENLEDQEKHGFKLKQHHIEDRE